VFVWNPTLQTLPVLRQIHSILQFDNVIAVFLPRFLHIVDENPPIFAVVASTNEIDDLTAVINFGYDKKYPIVVIDIQASTIVENSAARRFAPIMHLTHVIERQAPVDY